MAASTVTVTVENEELLGRLVAVLGTLAISAAADTYATGGLALGAAQFAGKVVLAPNSKAKYLEAKGKAGYHFEYDKANGKLIVRVSAAAASPEGELAAAATPAALSGDTIRFFALFDKMPAV